MLGVALCHQLKLMGFEVSTLDRSLLDAQHPNLEVIAASGVNSVVNAIGLINRRIVEPESNFLRVNSIFPRRLADLCESLSIPMIHVSTDCVFKGDAGPYDECSNTNATDLYGMSKHWGEPINCLVLRTSIIGPELNNHYALLSWFLKQKGAGVHGFINHRWNGITTLELARVIGEILRLSLWQRGIRHIYGQDLTKYELLQMIQSTFKSEGLVEPVNDRCSRDTRLRTIYPDFLRALKISPMAEQLEQIKAVCDPRGYWAVNS